MSSGSSSSLYLVLESGCERKIAASNQVLRLVQGLWAYYVDGVESARYILYLRRPMRYERMGNFLQNTCNFAIDSFYKLDEIGPELEAYWYWSVYHKDGTERARMAQDCRALELLTEDGNASDAAGEPGEVAQLREDNKALREQMDQVTRLNCELVQSTWALQESKARVLQLEAVLSELESRLVGIKTQSARDLVAAHDLLEAERARRRLACECRVSTVNTVGCKFGSTACVENMALALDYFALQRGVDAPRALSHGCEQLRRVIPLKSMLGYATTCRFLLQLDEQSAVFLVGLVANAQQDATEMADFLLPRLKAGGVA